MKDKSKAGFLILVFIIGLIITYLSGLSIYFSIQYHYHHEVLCENSMYLVWIFCGVGIIIGSIIGLILLNKKRKSKNEVKTPLKNQGEC